MRLDGKLASECILHLKLAIAKIEATPQLYPAIESVATWGSEGRKPLDQLKAILDKAKVGAAPGAGSNTVRPGMKVTVAFDGDHPSGRVEAQPFDPDAARAGADIPEQLAVGRVERGDGQCPHCLFRQLAVVGELGIGQTGRQLIL